MNKTLIVAIFLSQTLISTALTWEWKNYEYSRYIRRVNTTHIHVIGDGSGVVTVDGWATPKAPILYYQYWDCRWRQTAQQCVAIYSVLQQGLGK